jgi:hypothetical protein
MQQKVPKCSYWRADSGKNTSFLVVFHVHEWCDVCWKCQTLGMPLTRKTDETWMKGNFSLKIEESLSMKLKTCWEFYLHQFRAFCNRRDQKPNSSHDTLRAPHFQAYKAKTFSQKYEVHAVSQSFCVCLCACVRASVHQLYRHAAHFKF